MIKIVKLNNSHGTSESMCSPQCWLSKTKDSKPLLIIICTLSIITEFENIILLFKNAEK